MVSPVPGSARASKAPRTEEIKRRNSGAATPAPIKTLSPFQLMSAQTTTQQPTSGGASSFVASFTNPDDGKTITIKGLSPKDFDDVFDLANGGRVNFVRENYQPSPYVLDFS